MGDKVEGRKWNRKEERNRDLGELWEIRSRQRKRRRKWRQNAGKKRDREERQG